MLEAAPKHLFSNDFVVRSAGRTTAVIDVSVWGERAEFDLDGVPHRLYREGFMSGAFVLERAGLPIVKATKPSAFRTRFEFEYQGRTFVLKKKSAFSRGFVITSGDTQIGSIRPAGLLTRRTLIELPPDWPPALELFVFWLVIIIWKREAAAAS